MKIQHIILLLGTFFLPETAYLQNAPALHIPFETNPNQTVTYQEAIAAYRVLEAQHPKQFRLEVVGSTDSGQPLHLGILSTDGVFDAEKIRASGRRILLINNGIHPGEPEGIDATIFLLRDFLENKEKQKKLEHLVILAIPIYNIGGALNRNAHSRANQNGPESYGFRGNAKNYDLNRDFIKCDSKNAQSFTQLFQRWQPDVFIDNHTSNGADYQHVMTLIPTEHGKLTEPLGSFLDTKMVPALFADMEKKGWPMAPYVETIKGIPDSGIVSFLDYPRYSSGYAALWNCIGFIPETHMLKPFAQRLQSTYDLMETIIDFVDTHHLEIGRLRAQAQSQTAAGRNQTALDWTVDMDKVEKFPFKGYAAKYKTSEVTGQQRLWYDRTAPWEADIPFFKTYKNTKTRQAPKYYIIPKAWAEVIQRLDWNNVKYRQLSQDTSFLTETYFIKKYETREAYEGHYLHYNIEIEAKSMQRRFQKGDILVPVNQEANNYLMATLEPDAPDSWFAWNFFEPILMQKEWFSPYVFEDEAAVFLQNNPTIKGDFEEKKKTDVEFAKNAWAQLYWIYQKTPHYEPTHRMYPVARINE